MKDYFLKDHVDLSVSYDFDAREKSDLVLSNILKIPKPISILMLASSKVLEMDISKMIMYFNGVENIKSVEIKPYSSNQANDLNISNKDFEIFIQKWMNSGLLKNFNFINKELIESAKNKSNNAFSDDHVYITPDGCFAVLEFDKNDEEFFLNLDTFDDYIQWTKIEEKRVKKMLYAKNVTILDTALLSITEMLLIIMIAVMGLLIF